MAVTQTQLTQLYLAYFGRPPDFDGLVYYTTQPTLSIWDVAASFSASPESVALYGPTFNAAQINAIYQNLFNRDAEPAGLLYWSQEVALGHLTPAGVAYAILLGAQNADLVTVNNKMGVATAWIAALNTSEEITGYAGDDAAAVARDFLHTVDSTPASVTTALAGLDAAIADAVDANLPPTFALSVDAPSVVEGDAGTKLMTFTLTLDHASDSPLTLNYQTQANGTATPGGDFQTIAGTVTFAAGQTVATVSVTVLADTTFEAAESVHVLFSGSSLTAPVTATGTITNDDVDPATLVYVVSANSPTVTEGDTGTKTLTFTISLDVPAVQAVTVNYQTLLSGTALSGDDFEGTAGVITFAPGQQTAVVNVIVSSDVTVESDETVLVQITGAQLTNSGYTATGTIVDNDITPQLTTQIDTINVLGTGANIVKGVVDGTTPSNNTFSVGDTIHGNGLTAVQLAVAVGGTGAFAYMNDIASVDIIAGVGTAINFNAIEWDNIGAVNLAGGVNNLTVHITSLEDGVDLTIASAVGGQISATYQDGLYADIWNFGKGGASLIDGDVNIVMADSVSAGAYFSDSKDLALGDITITGGADNASATFSAIMFDADVSVGAIAIDVGDSATGLVHLSTTGAGDVAIASIGMVGGDSADLTVSITTTGGDVTVGGVAQVVADNSADANFYVYGGGAVTVGDIDQTIGNNGASASVSITTTGDADINVGNITQLGGTSASEYAYVYANGDGSINVGNVTQVAGKSASVSISADGSGDVTVGDISQGVTSGASGYVFVYADSGDITVGDITQVGSDDAYVSVSISNSGDITVGNVVQTVGDSGSNSAYLYVSGDGVVTVGDITQTVGDTGYAYMSVSSTGDITVGDMTAVGGASASAYAYVLGDANVTIGDVNLSIGDGAGNTSAEFQATASGDITIGDVSVVAGDNNNAHAYVTNNASGDIVVGDVVVMAGGNTNTLTNESPEAYFGVWNYAGADKNITVGNVSMAVGVSGSGYLSVSNTGTFNMDLGDITVGNIDVTLGDKVDFNVLIQNTWTASTTLSATNIVDVGSLTVGDIDIVAGTNATVDVTISNALWQSFTNMPVGGNVGDVSVGMISVDGGVGADVAINVNVSNTASGDVGNVSFGGFSLDLDDGASGSVTVDVYANAGAIGNVALGDLRAIVGVSGTVSNFDVEVTGQSIGNVSIGDIELVIGQDGSATNGIDVDVNATAGNIGDITVGNISIDVGESADQQTITISASATGDIGAVSFGNISLVVGLSGSADGVMIDITAGGDIESFSMGDFTAVLGTGASVSTMLDVGLVAANIGDITVGNFVVTMGVDASASSDGFAITATGDIGNVTFGNIEYHLTGAGASASGAYRNIDAGGVIGDVTFGDIGMFAATSASITNALSINVYGDAGIGDVTFGNVTLQGTAMADSLTANLLVSATSGDIGNVTLGDLSVNLLSASYDGSINFRADASGDMGDITVGNVDISVLSGSTAASATVMLNFTAGSFTGDAAVGDISMAADSSGYALFSLNFNSDAFSGDLSVGNVSFNGTTSATLAVNINADSGDVTIGGLTIEGSGVFGADYLFNVTGDDIHIGTVAFDVSAATGAYNLTSALAGVVAGGTLTLGTVDYSGWVATTTTQIGETIDVSGFLGDITIIGTGRGDTITDNAESNVITGGAGTDVFVFGMMNQNIISTTLVSAMVIDTITDFKAGPLFAEKITLDSNLTAVGNYAEKTATSFANFITVALATLGDPDVETDVVAVQVGADVYIAVDQDGGDNIDHIVKLTGVSTATLNFADFAPV